MAWLIRVMELPRVSTKWILGSIVSIDVVVYRIKAGNRGSLAELLKQSEGRSTDTKSEGSNGLKKSLVRRVRMQLNAEVMGDER